MYKELENLLRAVEANKKISLRAARDLMDIKDVSFSEIFFTAISYLSKSQEKDITISKAQDLAIKEIEENLFTLPKDAKEAYIDRVLYRLFQKYRYLFDVGDVGSEGFIVRYLAGMSSSISSDNDNEEFYNVLYDSNEVISFVLLTRRFLTELLTLIKTFGLEYKKNEYPLEMLLKLNNGEEYFNKQLEKIPRIFAIEMSKLDDPIIQKEESADVSIKKFEDYLHHDNKEKLLEVLHTLLDGKKGKVVAVILLALQELGIIYLGGYRSEIYRSMREEFGEIGDNSGINRYMNHYLSNTGDIKKEVSKVMAMLEKSNI